MSVEFDALDQDLNPLDSVEDVLNAQNWTFNRLNNDELTLQITGKNGQYRLFFIWQEDMNALQFCCHYDLHIMENNVSAAQTAISSLNENLWMGHFDLPKDTGTPSFRYTALIRGNSHQDSTDLLQDIVDISLAQCEQHYPVFTMLASANDINDQTLSLALMDTAGES